MLSHNVPTETRSWSSVFKSWATGRCNTTQLAVKLNASLTALETLKIWELSLGCAAVLYTMLLPIH